MNISSATPLQRRFIGATRLVTLHLWRVAKSTDLDEGFACARQLGMIDSSNEEFIRRCLAMADSLEKGASGAGDCGGAPSSAADSQVNASCACATSGITPELIDELQVCVLRLNSADPA